MKTTLVVLVTSALWALTAAYPRPAAAPSSPERYDVVVPRTNENGTDITTVDETVPVFVLPCECPAANCQYPNMSAKSLCECKASAAQACYIKSSGGCAMPKVDAC